MLWKRQRKESQKQSLELPHKSPMNTNVSHFRHTIYSKYSAHYFYNIALYPLRFSTHSSKLLAWPKGTSPLARGLAAKGRRKASLRRPRMPWQEPYQGLKQPRHSRAGRAGNIQAPMQIPMTLQACKHAMPSKAKKSSWPKDR